MQYPKIRLFLPCLLLGLMADPAQLEAQIPYQVVPLTAEVSTSPPSITVQWPLDPTAPFYKVRRKPADQHIWQELATLPGTVMEYVDVDVAIGDHWEYSVVRSAPLTIMDTLCVTPGTNVVFTIHDTGGNGLCCWNSDGFWELYACGKLIATGARYEFQDQHQFMMCGTSECDEVVVLIYPDHQFEEISWELNTEDGMLIGMGYPDMAPRFGYILAGIEAPAIEQQGTILLLVSSLYAEELDMELERLRQDLIGEGWLVQRADISPDEAVSEVKEIVLNAAAEHEDLNALFLIGNIPVPYSGKIAPDGHDDHLGAWPADLYYAELDGPWTDYEVDWSPAQILPRNHNVPGDGKFDQSTLPSDVDLILGRIDFSGLTVFGTSEVELLRSYLDRNHAFRTGQMTFERRAVIDENFPWFDHESAVYRSCIPMFGIDAVYEAPFISTLSAEPHLWAMAGGPGSYSSALGIGNSQDLANTPLQGAFAHVLGSYFGDWDVPNNFMRTMLGSGTMLGVVWGLQEMVFHHMALGMPMGECVRRSQNSRYDHYERHGRLTNLSLLGDPTLHLFPGPQVQAPQINVTSNGIDLSWPAVAEEILGYHIYRRSNPTSHFERVNEQAVIGTSFQDISPPPGTLEYMVRTIKLETTASGSYHVLGTGTVAEVNITLGLDDGSPFADVMIFPSPSQGAFTIRSVDITENCEVRLFHLSGEEVGISATRAQGEINITTEAAAGVYFLHLRTASGHLIQRSVAIIR